MDETSSRFVDKIAMERLVNEKLARVHHTPGNDCLTAQEPLFEDFPALPARTLLQQTGDTSREFPSPVLSPYSTNNTVPVLVKETGKARAGIIFLHGLFEDNRDIHAFLLKGLHQAGYTVYQTTLPFHYARTPHQSLFSGEYFWSADIGTCRLAFRQAVYELFQLYNTLRTAGDHPVYVVAFSMGGGIALTLMSLSAGIDGLFIINPICSPASVVLDSPLCRTIKEDYLSAGLSADQIIRLYRDFEPTNRICTAATREKICLACGMFDQITESGCYRALAEAWALNHVKEYRAGHLNILRVPRLAQDIHNFFTNLKAGE